LRSFLIGAERFDRRDGNQPHTADLSGFKLPAIDELVAAGQTKPANVSGPLWPNPDRLNLFNDLLWHERLSGSFRRRSAAAGSNLRKISMRGHPGTLDTQASVLSADVTTGFSHTQ
jgi:hypothetical protein